MTSSLPPIDIVHYRRITRLGAVRTSTRGLEAEVGEERLHIDVIAADVVRLAISRGGTFEERPTLAVVDVPAGEPVPFDVAHHPGAVTLTTAALVVTLGVEPFRLDVHRPDGTAVVESVVDDDAGCWAYATLNDAFVVRRRCRPADAFYGLGEKAGPHDRRRRDYVLWNTDVLDPYSTAEFTAGRPADDPRSDRSSAGFDPFYVSIPLLYHQTDDGAMAASFVDNGHRAVYDLTDPAEYRLHFAGGRYVEYLFAGPDVAAILAAYTRLTGRMPLPPLWSLGYHQCRWAKYTQDDVEAIAGRHRRHGIPCDALWLDIEHMDGYRVFTWDRTAFPDVEGMLARLAADGFRLVTIVDPGVKHEPGYEVYDQAAERGLLCRTEDGDIYLGEVWPGLTAFPDFAVEEARTWWGELNAAHVGSGVSGVWNDMNEPATGVIPPHRMRFDRGRLSHEHFHNQYALAMAMATTTGLLAALPQRRTFVLSRAGFAGIQRYAATWTGDNLSRWDHLAMSIPMTMGLGISGQPFAGADVGGFRGNTDAELFLRWMQYGVLTPFCRNHSEIGNVDQYSWTWGGVIEDLVRRAIELRYRLMPYLYAAFVDAAETGAPVMRPLVFDHQYDPVARGLDDEYLLGPDLLVAPVIAPGATARQVYLPDGDWYDRHTGEPLEGARFHHVATPMDRIPVYARGGAVVPMWPNAPPSTAGHHPAVIELHLYVPQRNGSFRSLLHEDDGVSFATHGGAHLRTTLDVTRAGGRLLLRGTVSGNGYPESARTAFHLVVHGAAVATAASVDGDEAAVRDGRLVIPNAGQDFTVELSVA